MAMRGQVLSAYALLSCIIVSAIAFGGAGEGEVLESGDYWTYNVDMTTDGLDLKGTTTYTFDGESTKSIAGNVYSTYEIRFDGSMAITGLMSGKAASGEASIYGVESLDQVDLDTIVTDQNMSMNITLLGGSVPVTMKFWDHNVSTYSPPGGTGEEPENLDVGDSWTKTYTVHSEVTRSDDGNITKKSFSKSTTVTYTYLGIETIISGAGTFECHAVQADDGESITTDWYSDEVGMSVKSVYESDFSESGTQILKSFSYTPPSTPAPSGGGPSNVFVFMAVGVAVAAIVVVVVAWILMRKKSPPKVQQADLRLHGSGPPIPPEG
jgi:hypothetical protein